MLLRFTHHVPFASIHTHLQITGRRLSQGKKKEGRTFLFVPRKEEGRKDLKICPWEGGCPITHTMPPTWDPNLETVVAAVNNDDDHAADVLTEQRKVLNFDIEGGGEESKMMMMMDDLGSHSDVHHHPALLIGEEKDSGHHHAGLNAKDESASVVATSLGEKVSRYAEQRSMCVMRI